MFIDDPTAAEFYPRRLYACAGTGNFCIVNNAAAPAWRDWDAATGLEGLMAAIRKWHQPAGDGTREHIADIARQMIELAVERGHLDGDANVFRKVERA